MDKNLQRLIIPLGIALGASILLLVLRSIGFKWLGHWTKRTAIRSNDSLDSVLRLPSFCWVVAIALYVGIAFSEIPPKVSIPLCKSIHIILILSASLVMANVSAMIFKNLMHRPGTAIPTSGLSLGIIRGSWIVLGILLCLSAVGISVAPLLTALGVGGLAVALALKDTLENLFAGIYLITDRTIRVGDYIKLENGQEGSVADIGWRTSKILALNNTTIIISNNKLAQSIVNNYSLPDRKYLVSIPVSVAMATNPDLVERVLTEIIKTGSEDIVGVVSIPEPCVRLNPGFGSGSLDFTLSFSVNNFPDQSFAKHEIRKRILTRFQKENILFPSNTVQLVTAK
jgi:small-conductance mechanosensitive channel